jgi:hypothetical protein
MIAPTIPLMSEDQDEVTHQVRQFLINNPRMIRMLARSPEGRKQLQQHQRRSTQMLKTATDWREASYAAWMLLQVNKALATAKRRRPRTRPALPGEKAVLASCYRLANTIASVLGEAALDGLKPNMSDISDAYRAADRIRGLTKEYRQ